MLVDQIEVESVFVDSDVRGENTIGSVVVSAVLSGTGEELSGEYTLKVSSRSGGTGTVTVEATTPNNPYDGRVTAGVAFDDTTDNTTVLPGVTIKFDNAAVDNDEALVQLGNWTGSFDASGVSAGTPSAGVRHKVINDGSEEVSEAQAVLRTQAVHVKHTGKVFSYVSPFAENAVEKTAGGGSSRTTAYVMSIDNVTGSGSGRTADLLIDGGAVGTNHIKDLTTGTTMNGIGLKTLSPGYRYRFVDGPLEGLEFELDATCADNDFAHILIFPSRYVQIASDSAGVAGTYGIDPVVLTQSGEASGVIQPTGAAFYWSRILVPESAGNESNPYPGNVSLEASQAQSAEW